MSRYIDKEYEEAKSADEKEEYFYVTHKMFGGKVGHSIKKYKPSVAKLFAERTGDVYEMIRDLKTFHEDRRSDEQ